MSRELTHDEMKAVIQAAIDKMPADVKKDCRVIIFFNTSTPGGEWINRISNMPKTLTNEVLLTWTKWILNRNDFGEPTTN